MSARHGVLLLHGLGGSPAELSYLKRRLGAAGYVVEVPTLPGHRQHADALKSIRWPQYVEAAQQAFDALARQTDTVSVSGLCLGAVLSLALGIENGARVGAICPISTTLRFDGWSLPYLARFIRLLRYTPVYYWYQVKEEHPYGVKDEAIRRWLAAEMKEDSATHYSRVPFQSVYEMHALSAWVLEHLHRVVAPVCAIHPLEDEVSSVKSVEVMQQRLTAPFESLILKDSYHLATIDKERRLVADTVGEFVKRHTHREARG